MVGLCLSVQASAQTLAFPEAEGYGRYATGGRGGNVYYVTTLDDCSDTDLVPGTLRWALRDGDDTPRTILFKVCGTIYLTSKLKFAHPNVTIAGQTAPGGGICIAGACIYVCKPNVIIRHIRFRAGDIPNSSYPSLDVENAKNVIIDHCSMTWSMEECLTMYDNDSTTVQWCIIGEGLYYSKHIKGQRSYATQWGGEHSTMHHTLITHCYNRTPRFNGVRDDAHLNVGNHDHDAMVDSEFANNVIFNWGKANSLYGGENDTTVNHDSLGNAVGYCRVYMENNYFRAGPMTKAQIGAKAHYFVQGSMDNDYGQWYLNGNMYERSNTYNNSRNNYWKDATLALINEDNMYGYVEGKAERAFNLDGLTPSQAAFDQYVLTEKQDSSDLVIEPAEDAYVAVCQQAGASLPRYDEEDTRLLAEAAGLQAPQFRGDNAPGLGIIDSQDDITFVNGMDRFMVAGEVKTGYPLLDAAETDSLAEDTDLDGMPDLYETANGLDPNDASDGAALAANGYTNLENWLNGVASGTIDKTAYETLPYVSQMPQNTDPTAVEGVVVDSKPAILNINGTLYILKNGGKYTLSGQKIE